MSKLLIIGAGGHAKVVVEIALMMNKWKKIACLDDNTSLNKVLGIPIIGETKDYKKFKDD